MDTLITVGYRPYENGNGFIKEIIRVVVTKMLGDKTFYRVEGDPFSLSFYGNMEDKRTVQEQLDMCLSSVMSEIRVFAIQQRNNYHNQLALFESTCGNPKGGCYLNGCDKHLNKCA